MLESCRTPCLGFLVLAVVLVGLPAAAQVPPLGPDFEVGAADGHECSVVAVDPYGQFLVAWAEYVGPGTIVAHDRDGGYRGVHYLPVAILSERPIHVVPGHAVGFVAAWGVLGVEAGSRDVLRMGESVGPRCGRPRRRNLTTLLTLFLLAPMRIDASGRIKSWSGVCISMHMLMIRRRGWPRRRARSRGQRPRFLISIGVKSTTTGFGR